MLVCRYRQIPVESIARHRPDAKQREIRPERYVQKNMLRERCTKGNMHSERYTLREICSESGRETLSER